MSAPVIVLAIYRARKLVKEDLRAKGIKVSEVPKRDIDVLARLYLELHPELIPAARETIDKLTLDGVFGKRAQRALRAKLASDAQSKIEPISITSAVQNS
jgi:hypothetical protein